MKTKKKEDCKIVDLEVWVREKEMKEIYGRILKRDKNYVDNKKNDE